MAFQTIQMGLFDWNSPNDTYSYEQLSQNWQKINFHDHTPGRGVQLSSNSFQDHSITGTKIALGTIEGDNIDPTTSATVNNLTVTNELTLDQPEGVTRWNIVYGGSGSSENMIDGELLFTGAHSTVYLPSATATTFGEQVCIVADSTVTTTAPVTIQTSTGQYIFGQNLSNETSIINLDNPYQYVVLISKVNGLGGPGWIITSGCQDTGWVSLNLNANWIQDTPAAFRVIDGIVYLSGALTATSSSSGESPFTLPGVACPSSTKYVLVSYQANNTAPLEAIAAVVSGLGVFGITVMPSGNSTLNLDGVSFRI